MKSRSQLDRFSQEPPACSCVCHRAGSGRHGRTGAQRTGRRLPLSHIGGGRGLGRSEYPTPHTSQPTGGWGASPHSPIPHSHSRSWGDLGSCWVLLSSRGWTLSTSFSHSLCEVYILARKVRKCQHPQMKGGKETCGFSSIAWTAAFEGSAWDQTQDERTTCLLLCNSERT